MSKLSGAGLARLRFFTFLGLFFAMCGGPATEAGQLAFVAPSLDRPTVGQTLETDSKIVLGRGTLVADQGAVFRELLAGGERCGVLLDGPGEFTYAVENRFSIPVAERNIERASKLKANLTDGVLTTETQIDGAVIWGWDFAGLEAKDEADPTEGSPLPEWAEKILDAPYFSRPSHELVTAKRLQGSRGVSYVLLHGSSEDLLLNVDPVVDRLEVLYRVDRVRDTQSVSHNRHYLEELAAQPVGRHWWDRFPAPLVAVHEAISVDNDEDEHVTVKTTSTLQATRDGVGLWRAELIQGRIKNGKVLPNNVISVRVNGTANDFLHQDSGLLVPLDPPLQSGSRVTIEVVNEGQLALPPLNDSYWSLGTWPWYPQPDLNGEFATIEIELRVPEPYQPFASGNRVSEETRDGHKILKTKLDKPVQYPVVAAGKYHVYSGQQDGVTCRVASYVFGKEKPCNRLISNFFAASQFYSALFGVEFPYDELDVIEINDWGFGQAPPGIIFITQEAYTPTADVMSRLYSGGVNERYVHEIAHTWWGQIVKKDAYEEQWLSESFAEYSAALCIEAMHGGGRKGAKEFNRILNGWKNYARGGGRDGSIYLANRLAEHDEKDYEDRIHLLYAKGPLVIHALRQELRRHYGSDKEGDRYFVVLLSSFVKNHNFRWATTKNLIGILNQMTGTDWQPWFERYVFGTEMPEIR